MASANPYVVAGKLKTFSGDTVYAVQSKGEKLMLWGDLMHLAAVQFDSNNKLAEAARKKAFAEAAKKATGWA